MTRVLQTLDNSKLAREGTRRVGRGQGGARRNGMVGSGTRALSVADLSRSRARFFFQDFDQIDQRILIDSFTDCL